MSVGNLVLNDGTVVTLLGVDGDSDEYCDLSLNFAGSEPKTIRVYFQRSQPQGPHYADVVGVTLAEYQLVHTALIDALNAHYAKLSEQLVQQLGRDSVPTYEVHFIHLPVK